MPEVSFPKVESALICDSVRTEDNGKQILIGVYSGEILVGEFPASLLLHAFLILDMPPNLNGSFKLKIEAIFDDKEVTRMEGEIVNDGGGPVPLSFPLPLRKIEREGELSLHMQFNDQPEKRPIISRQILLSSLFEPED